jgi:phosphoglycerate dehydrogenase-like enzyme
MGACEDELGGKSLRVVGRGRIGARLARLAKAFDMTVLATRRNPDRGADSADAVFGHDRLREVLPKADIVALTCPLKRETENLIDAEALALMKPTAQLVIVARRGVIDEAALISARQEGRIAAGLDVTRVEPLAGGSCCEPCATF